MGLFSIFTCKCKVLVPSLGVAKTRELPNAAYALLLPAVVMVIFTFQCHLNVQNNMAINNRKIHETVKSVSIQ